MAITTVNNRTLKRVCDQWRFTANITANAAPIASNLEQVDTGGQGTIGSAMTQSSGVFTFPSTGIWLVRFFCRGNSNSSGDNVGIMINVTTNNSSYAGIADSYEGGESDAFTLICESLVDVTDTANVKVSFTSQSITSDSALYGSTSTNQNAMTFIRLGDT